MAIAGKHFYHGAALSLITDHVDFVGLSRIKDIASNAFALNNNIGVFVKHTEGKASPWVFGFTPEHQEAVRHLFDRFKKRAFVVCVCPPAGICILTYGEYAAVIDENFNVQGNLTIKRPSGGGFRVNGPKGQLKPIIPLKRFPQLLFESSRH